MDGCICLDDYDSIKLENQRVRERERERAELVSNDGCDVLQPVFTTAVAFCALLETSALKAGGETSN